MNIAFFLYKYFPFGGLQQDFIQILYACQKRQHQIRVYTMKWDDEIPYDINVTIIKTKGYTNHVRNESFYNQAKEYLTKHPADIIVGFNKMPGLDFYYAADVCYAEKIEKEKSFFYKLTKRYKHYIAYEKAVFNINSHTKLLMLTQHQINNFKKHYNTPDSRFYLLPPGININKKNDQQITNTKTLYRKKHDISLDHFFLLQVGSDFKRKGVDRSIKAIASLPKEIKNKTILMVVGQYSPNRYQRLAKKLNINNNVIFFDGRHDIAELMAAADILMHPAYQEAAGIVLIEAIVAGLPVITTDICGYATYIKQANCGIVINEPYKQKTLNNALAISLTNKTLLNKWKKSAYQFANTRNLYNLHEKVADIILEYK